jgi:hypothetical protein
MTHVAIKKIDARHRFLGARHPQCAVPRRNRVDFGGISWHLGQSAKCSGRNDYSHRKV